MAVNNFPSPEPLDFPKMIENGQIVVVNNPLMLYSPSTANDCSLVLNTCKDSNFTQSLPDLVVDANYFQYENGKTVLDFSNNFDFAPQKSVTENVTLLEVYSSTDRDTDKPDYIDISKLSELKEKSGDSSSDVYELSEDDEVIFVKEYKDEKRSKSPLKKKKGEASIRRNPVRTVRNKSKDLSKELLFEEDFAFLDASDEEAEYKVSKKVPTVKLPKEWPINVHERPEYNPVTKKIEYFDYTIREIQESAQVFKKPKSETRKLPKKEPVVRKRRGRMVRDKKEMVPLSQLKPLVNSTTDMLKEYFINSKKHKDLVKSKSDICTFENKLQVLKNQALLFALVNNLDETEVVEKFKLLNTDSDTRS